MNLPDDAAILRLHKKYAPHDHAFEIVYGHSQIVADIAAQLIAAKQLTVDSAVVHAGALLHDIGYYPLFDDSGYVPKDRLITHGVVGADLLRAEGLPEAVCRMAERHTGVGLTKESIVAQHLPLPARDLVAETTEEELVMYADKLHTKAITTDDPHDVLGCFLSPERYLQHALKFGKENGEKFARLVERYGVPDLPALAQTYGQQLEQ